MKDFDIEFGNYIWDKNFVFTLFPLVLYQKEKYQETTGHLLSIGWLLWFITFSWEIK